jgi:hypothetical protein
MKERMKDKILNAIFRVLFDLIVVRGLLLTVIITALHLLFTMGYMFIAACIIFLALDFLTEVVYWFSSYIIVFRPSNFWALWAILSAAGFLGDILFRRPQVRDK